MDTANNNPGQTHDYTSKDTKIHLTINPLKEN